MWRRGRKGGGLSNGLSDPHSSGRWEKTRWEKGSLDNRAAAPLASRLGELDGGDVGEGLGRGDW